MKLHRKLISLLLTAALLLGTLALPASAAGTPFTDVPENIWYQDAVTYVYEHGLFNGTGDGSTFSPNAPMTRGMFVQVLSNKTSNFDKSTWTGKSSFSDVSKDKWYAPAVEWAYRAELISGVGDGKFAPEKNVTREQMAVIMYNYAKKTGNDASFDSDILSQFPDGGSVSSWAKEAMQWAVTHKVVNGSNGKLNPQNNAQRCEVAQVAVNADPVLENTTVEADPDFDPTFVDPTPDDLPEGACTYREFREIFSGKVTVVGNTTYMASTGVDFNPADVKAVDLVPFDVLKKYAMAAMGELGLIGDTDAYIRFTFRIAGLGGEIRLDYTAPINQPNYSQSAEFYFFKSRLDMYY